jgi:hypothetical protein
MITKSFRNANIGIAFKTNNIKKSKTTETNNRHI